MFARLGRAVVYHPWRVIALWIVAAVVIVAFSPSLSQSSDESDFLPRHYESIKAAELQDKAFPQAFTPSVVMVFQRKDGAKLTADDSNQVAQISTKLKGAKLKDVEQVVPGQPSPNKLVQTAGVQMPEINNGNYDRILDSTDDLRTELQKLLKGSDLKVGTTGTAAMNLDQRESSSNADAIIALATVALIIILLLVIFRSPIIALLPIVVIGIVSQVANGLIATISKVFGLQADSSINQLLIVVLFGVGTDYILFLLFRYRERLRAGEDPKQAMVSAVTRAGEAIASAAGVVIIAFLAMALSSLSLFRMMGPSLAIAVAVTLIAGLTLVPAIVSLIGTKVFWPSKAWKKEPTGARFAAVGRALGRRPAVYAGVAGAVMIALALGALNFNPTFDLSSGAVPKTAESQVALKDLQKGLPPGATDPTDVYLTAAAGKTLDKGTLGDYGNALKGVKGVGGVGAPTLSKDGRTADYTVTLANNPESDAALHTVSGPLRDVARSQAPDGSTALVGGTTSVYVDLHSAMNRDYTVIFPVAAILIMIVLALLLRSLVAPWYLMVSVGLGFASTLGATTLLFQNIQGHSGLIFMMPVIMYMFVVALGTDYNILMVARLREEAKEGKSPRDAAAMAIRHAGPTIAAAGVILAGSFGALLLAGNSLLSEMGFATGFGILVAAFVMAMFFTPALTALLGHFAWWPGHGDDGGGSEPKEPAPVLPQSAREPVSDAH